MANKTFVDQLGREVFISGRPIRIISLVPSITDFLHHLNLDKEVVGITKFCIHPHVWFKSKTRVGGTKKLNLDKIKALQPDLIIGNKEENTEEEINILSNQFPVWMSDVNSFNDAMDMIEELGPVLYRTNECRVLLDSIRNSFKGISNIGQDKSVLYFIWHEPNYVVGNFTYIGSIMNTLGFINHCEIDRYPDLDDLSIDSPDYVFLSSEPFPFTTRHIDYFQKKFPESKIVLVNGEMFSWYGSYMLKVPNYINTDLKKLL